MEICITETLEPAERAHLMEWRDRVFPVEGKDYRWSELQPSLRHL